MSMETEGEFNVEMNRKGNPYTTRQMVYKHATDKVIEEVKNRDFDTIKNLVEDIAAFQFKDLYKATNKYTNLEVALLGTYKIKPRRALTKLKNNIKYLEVIEENERKDKDTHKEKTKAVERAKKKGRGAYEMLMNNAKYNIEKNQYMLDHLDNNKEGSDKTSEKCKYLINYYKNKINEYKRLKGIHRIITRGDEGSEECSRECSK